MEVRVVWAPEQVPPAAAPRLFFRVQMANLDTFDTHNHRLRTLSLFLSCVVVSFPVVVVVFPFGVFHTPLL